MNQQRAPLPALAVELLPVAHLVVDAGHQLAFANARAQEMLGVGAEHIGLPIDALDALAMSAGELRLLIEQAHAARGALMRAAVKRRAAHAGPERLDIIAVPLRDRDDAPLGTGLVVLDSLRVLADRELETANLELKGANEALEGVNAQLQSANELLQQRIADLERAGPPAGEGGAGR